MRIGVVTDAACDLPRTFLDRHAVAIVPLTVQTAQATFVDKRDPVDTLAFYKSLGAGGLHSATVQTPTASEISELFLQRLVIDYDFVFCITMDTSASTLFEHATQASYRVLSGYRRVRKQAGVEGPFALRVINSRSLFTGQGVIIAELLRCLGHDPGISELRQHIERFCNDVYAYVLPADVNQLRSTAAASGDQRVGWAGSMFANTLNIKPIFRIHDQAIDRVFKAVGYRHGAGKLLELTAAQIEKGLKAPFVCISFGGNPRAVSTLPNFDLVEKTAHAHGVDLMISEMSPAAAVTAGRQALSVAFAADAHSFA